MPKSEIRYHSNVACILRNAQGEILICERLDTKGAWQFPQGSMEEGETPEQTLRRELNEEIGIKRSDFTVLEQRGPYRYLYGEGRKKKGYHGKEQQYFLAETTRPDVKIDLETHHPEFRAYRWIRPEEFRVSWLNEPKREVYRQVFQDFFGIKL
jgi:putative (di)nucleoside polyphosphate hydrolase